MIQQITIEYSETREITIGRIRFTVWVKSWNSVYGKFAWGFLNDNGPGLGDWEDTPSGAWAAALEAISKAEQETDDLAAFS